MSPIFSTDHSAPSLPRVWDGWLTKIISQDPSVAEPYGSYARLFSSLEGRNELLSSFSLPVYPVLSPTIKAQSSASPEVSPWTRKGWRTRFPILWGRWVPSEPWAAPVGRALLSREEEEKRMGNISHFLVLDFVLSQRCLQGVHGQSHQLTGHWCLRFGFCFSHLVSGVLQTLETDPSLSKHTISTLPDFLNPLL